MLTGFTPEGFGYVVKRSGSAVGYCALSIGCGTRDEGSFPAGIAHFTEHAIFKGTAHRSSRSINSCLEKLGGELNAFTTKEETVIHATVLKEDLSKALKLLVELATEPSFPTTEIEIEKGVVMDEIQSYKDSPADDIYDCFEERLFKGHPLATPILGTLESVPLITVDDLKAYTAAGFIPSRMVLSMVADLPEERMVAMISKAVCRKRQEISPLRPSASGRNDNNSASGRNDSFLSFRANEVSREISMQSSSQFHITEKKDNHEANAVFGNFAPSLAEKRERLVAGLLANILGGPASNSILGSILREKHGWVYGVEAAYTPYKETGIMAISFGCDPSNLSKASRTLRSTLARFCEKPMAERTFASAKKQILGQMAVSNANGEAQCLGLGKSMLAFGHVVPDSIVREEILSITAEELRSLSEKIFGAEGYSSLIFV